MAVPYTFGTATAAIPLSQLDSNFATAVTIGNTAVQLGNTVTTLNNLTLANVTISSGSVTITNVTVTTANATTANVGTLVVTANATVAGNVSVTGNVSMNVATITTANVTTTNTSSLVVTGNQSFVGTGNRITGDMSSTTLANRVGFQSSTVNGQTALLALPNGTGTQTQFQIINSSDAGNASVGQFLISSTEIRFAGTLAGTGTYLPMTFYTSGSERMRIDTSGRVAIGTSSPNTSATLTLKQTASAYQIQLEQSNVATAGYAFRCDGGDGDLTFNRYETSAFTERMRLTAAGSLGIGTSSPNASAILDAQSTTKGVRFPNMTTTQKNAISSPAAGLVVFDTTLSKLAVYSGSAWQTITSV